MDNNKAMNAAQNSTDVVVAGTAKPKRGRGGTGNFPASRDNMSQDKALVSKLLGEVLTEYKKPKVRDDEELTERLNDYFERCAKNGQIPTVEEMALSTGYSIKTVWGWQTGEKRGFSTQTGEIIRKSKSFLQTFDAKLVVAGKMNFLAYCFRAKNYYGMADKQEVVLTPNNPMGNAESDRALMDRYLDVIDVQDAEQQPE